MKTATRGVGYPLLVTGFGAVCFTAGMNGHVPVRGHWTEFLLLAGIVVGWLWLMGWGAQLFTALEDCQDQLPRQQENADE